jgi:serine/threonine protein kinase
MMRVAFSLTACAAHRDLFMKANILHRDISPHNLMVDPNDHNKGVLIDLDLAVRVRGSDKKPVGEPQPPGTMAFRSIDLCKEPPWEVFYRHDLESFFYVLVWILTHFDGGKLVLRNRYPEWQEGRLADIAGSKVGFLPDAKILAFPPRSRLRTSWIARLGKMFELAYRTKFALLREELLTDIPQPFDEETLGGHITYDQFMAILEAPDLAYLEVLESE